MQWVGDGRGSQKARELMRRARPTRLLLALVAGALLSGATSRWGLAAREFEQAPTGALVDLRDSAELRARFNADRGHVRLVLLLSPT